MDLSRYASALIVKPSSLGDIVHTLPAVHALKQAQPQLRLRWIAKPEWLPLISGSPDVDEVLPYPQKQLCSPFSFLQWAKEFRAQRWQDERELILDFQGLLRSVIICIARGSRPVLGLSDAREGAAWFYDETIAVDAQAHAVDRYLSLVRHLGIPTAEPQFRLPEGRLWGEALPQQYIALHPYSRGKGKSLSPAVLQALCTALAPNPVVLLGVSSEHSPVEGRHITDLIGRTDLAQLIWIMRQAWRIISVDSGPMHIAAAVNDHTLGIHTWSDPRKVGPYNPKAQVWKAGRICHKEQLSTAECLDTRAVTVDAVADIAAWV
jgi:ADP-heptose:LPS heptosyltransferase